MPTPWQRDLEADGKKLESWLCRRIPAASDLRMSPLVSPKTSGFSNETLLCDVEWTEDGERRKEPLVVRIQPIGYQVFLEYDLGLQFRTMERLAASDVPVPRVLWLEEQDDGIFGAPFYVMRKVEGRVPTDNPPYHMGGWLHDVTPEERRAIWLASFDCMARISTGWTWTPPAWAHCAGRSWVRTGWIRSWPTTDATWSGRREAVSSL
jgi:aminoglycoside phosphotransferase (APT) family kinase protein